MGKQNHFQPISKVTIKKIGISVIILIWILCATVTGLTFFKYFTLKPVVINTWTVPLRHTLPPYYEEFEYLDNHLVHYKINSDGFRDEEYSVTKPNNTFRIVVLGDSYTFGLGMQLNETLPKQLEIKLNEDTKMNYEVLNFGVPSFNTKEEVEMLKGIGLKYQPDSVIVAFMDNDVYDNEYNKEVYYNLSEEYKNRKLKPKQAQTEKLIWAEVDKRWNQRLKSMPFEETWKIVKDPLDELSVLAEKNNFEVMIFLYQGGSVYEERLKEICSEKNWYYVKFKKNIDIDDKDLSLSNYHPTPLMNRIASENIFNAILSYNLV